MFVFFKQKTEYEMLRSLVGSEMCIRDRVSQSVDAVEGECDGMGHHAAVNVSPYSAVIFSLA